MRCATCVCILGQLLILSYNAFGLVCDIEDFMEGEIIVEGEEVIFDGVTEVEGNVPLTGNVAFQGPVRASGTVTIIGKSQPMLPFGWMPSFCPSIPYPPFYHPFSYFPRASASIPEAAIGYGNIEAEGNEVSVIGETLVEGKVPVMGNVYFKGGVPAAGKVRICARF